MEMNTYWCLEQGRNESLACRRHALQRRHKEAGESERGVLTAALQALLSSASPLALAEMREETRQMKLHYCALPSFRQRELCTGEEPTTPPSRRSLNAEGGRRGGGGGNMARGYRGGGSKSGNKVQGGKKQGKAKLAPHGAAVLWGEDNLAALRRWYCRSASLLLLPTTPHNLSLVLFIQACSRRTWALLPTARLRSLTVHTPSPCFSSSHSNSISDHPPPTA